MEDVKKEMQAATPAEAPKKSVPAPQDAPAKPVKKAAPANPAKPETSANTPAPAPAKPAKPKPAPKKAAPVKPAPAEPVKPAASAPPTAKPARLRRRHFVLIAFFLLWVVVPLGGAGGYLYMIAKDQYASYVGFSVRKEEVSSAVELLGGITELSGSSSSDTDILYEFIQSQQMVRAIDAQLDLSKIYHHPEDPVFSLGEDMRVEALSRYWKRMVKVFYDNSSGLIEIRVLAFEPEDAHAIAEAVFRESSEMINRLSAIAREDTTRYAEEELSRAQEKLKAARHAKITFQNRTQIVDPKADIQGRMGLLNSLQSQLVEATIEKELLLENARANDPRLAKVDSKIKAIEKLIDEQLARFGGKADNPEEAEDVFVRLLGEFEVLEVEREFAEQSYLSAQVAYEAARAEAQRQSRYLATYIGPTRAETAEFPKRLVIMATLAVILLISWSILVMIYYSLRDRR